MMPQSLEDAYDSVSGKESCSIGSLDNTPKQVSAIEFRCRSSTGTSGDTSREVSVMEFTCGSSTGALDDISREVSAMGLTCGSSKDMRELTSHSKQVDSLDASNTMLPIDRKHAFWETQPVEQYQDRERRMQEEGPIIPPRSVEEVRTEPYKLPKHYEWCTCDLNCKDTTDEVYGLLSNHYVEDNESMFRYHYPKDFLQWALRPPGYFPTWHIGVRVEATKRLVAFITGIPANICLHGTCLRMAEVNFLCIHKKLRSKRLAPLLIKEVTRRVHLDNVWQAVYTAGIVLPTPIVTCHYWHRPLNPKKLIKVGFSQLGLGMTMGRTIKHYQLPHKVLTPGFRAMERRDVSAVTQLLRQYLLQFVVAPEFSEADVEHWLVPLQNVVNTYVIEDVESGKITDVCSFYTLPSTVLQHRKYTTLKAAYLFYNVTTKTPLPQLVNDLLIVAKCNDFDVFNVLDIMQNQSFLHELKFKLGDGQLRYYLYNYRIKEKLSPGDLGLILL